MADIFPRKGTTTLEEVRVMLAVDPVFNALSEAEQNNFINNAAQQVADLRNNEGKEDFNADTADIDLVA